jgi:hypothetical protein
MSPSLSEIAASLKKSVLEMVNQQVEIDPSSTLQPSIRSRRGQIFTVTNVNLETHTISTPDGYRRITLSNYEDRYLPLKK